MGDLTHCQTVRVMKLTQRGVGRQTARTSQVKAQKQVRLFALPFASLVLLAVSVATAGISGCAGYTSASPNGSQGDPKSAVLSAASSTLAFGSVPIATTASQNLTFTNTGTATANISQATISGTGFTVVGSMPTGSVGIGQSISVQIQFAPQSAGAASGTFSLASDASNSPATISLTGTGTTPGLVASPASVSFGGVNVGGSASNNVTLTNSGTSTITVSGVTATGSGITVSGIALPTTLTAGSNTSFTVQFAPTAVGNVSGSISIANSGPTSALTVAVTGAGAQAQISANPQSVNFGNVADGSTNSQPIQISNPGNAALTISQVTITGGSNGFNISGMSMPLTIQPGKSASFSASFGPSTLGALSGSISLASNAANSVFTINLSGTGAVPTRTLVASTTNVAFGNVNDGTTASQNVTITNTGNSAVTISTTSATGTGFNASGINPGIALNPNQTVTLSVSFEPSSPGAANGSASITSNATNSPLGISLSGTGVKVVQHSVALAWDASTTAGVVGYNVYRGTGIGSYVRISSTNGSTSFTDSTVQSGQNITYYYVVTAVDSTGTESSDSNQVTATIP
jgi:hypothetical protein